jgi:PAS domain S-box-containing protein
MAKDPTKTKHSITQRLEIPPEIVASTARRRAVVLFSGRGGEQEKETKIRVPPSQPSDSRYLALLQGLYDAAIIADRSGSILDANTRALKLTGYEKAELCKLRLLDIISGADETLLPLVFRNVEQGRFTVLDAFCARKDGLAFPAEIAMNLIFLSGEGELCAFIRDTSRRREIEDSLRRANKMRSLQLLAGGLAHDFNNLLTSVIGNIELVLSGQDAGSKDRRDLESALADAKSMADLSRRMLAYSGKGLLQRTKVDLNECVQAAVASVSDRVPRFVQVTTKLSPEPIHVGSESGLLESALRNLILNGIEAITSGQGIVVLQTSVQELDDDALAYYALQDDLAVGTYACVTARDNGVGMDANLTETIFDPFFTTKRTGRGLGLSEVQGIVAAHGGAIAVETAPGKGSVFISFLPLFKAVEQTPGGDADSGQAMQGTVLAVDDELSVRRYAERVLARCGFKVLVAEDGKQATQIFSKHHRDIDLVLMDIFMPKMNGDEALREMRDLSPDLKCLFMSGYSESAYRDKFQTDDKTRFLAKPFMTADLIRSIRELLQ